MTRNAVAVRDINSRSRLTHPRYAFMLCYIIQNPGTLMYLPNLNCSYTVRIHRIITRDPSELFTTKPRIWTQPIIINPNPHFHAIPNQQTETRWPNQTEATAQKTDNNKNLLILISLFQCESRCKCVHTQPSSWLSWLMRKIFSLYLIAIILQDFMMQRAQIQNANRNVEQKTKTRIWTGKRCVLRLEFFSF